MTERERLIKLLKSPHKAERLRKLGLCIGNYEDDCIEAMVADFLLANGVIVPPCKVGDTVFQIEKMCLGCLNYTDGGYSDYCECALDDNKNMFEVDFDKDCIYEIFKSKFIYSMIDKIGKTVFLTKEEAEKALTERKMI